MVTTPHTLIGQQPQLASTPHVAGAQSSAGGEAIPVPTPAAFELAVQALSVAHAIDHGAPHRPVHPAAVAALDELAGVILPPLASLPLYEAVQLTEARIRALPPAAQEALSAALSLDRALTRWRALPGKQAQAVELAQHVDVLGLGGGAGSSKTEAAIGIALYQQRTTRFLRRTSGEFQSILTRIGEVVGSVDGRNLGNNVWHLPPPYGFNDTGAAIEWLGLNDTDQVLKLQGRACSHLVLEDAGNGGVSEADYNFARNWLRSTEPGLHKLVTITMNPPSTNESVAFLRDKLFAPWVSPNYTGERAQSGEVRYFLIDGDSEHEVEAGTPGAQSRSLILSSVVDNPFLMRTGYATQLAQAPTAVLRDRLLHGDFTAGWDTDDASQVVPSAWVQAAMDRWTPDAHDALDALGVDVARGGKDRTAIAGRHGDWFSAPRILQGEATATGQRVAAAVLAARGTAKHAISFIDATGVGASPYDILREKVPTVAVIFGAGTKALDSTGSFGFVNIRSELWWRFRELLDPANARKIALPPDRALKAELCMPRYELRGGRLFVEGRDEIIKRLKRSPDMATAYVLAAISTNSTMARPVNKLARWAAGVQE